MDAFDSNTGKFAPLVDNPGARAAPYQQKQSA
jgi:hypothetical protein